MANSMPLATSKNILLGDSTLPVNMARQNKNKVTASKGRAAKYGLLAAHENPVTASVNAAPRKATLAEIKNHISRPNEFLKINSKLTLNSKVELNCRMFEMSGRALELGFAPLKKSMLWRQTSTAAAAQAMAK